MKNNHKNNKPRHPGNFPDYLSIEDFAEFLSHQTSVLDQLETFILEFEKGDLVNSANNIKRIMHTMKGESGFLALVEVNEVCHRTEDLLSEELSVNFTEILLQVKDWLSETFVVYSGRTGNPENYQDILDKFDQYGKHMKLKSKKSDTEFNDEIAQDHQPERNDVMESAVSISNSITINTERLDKLINSIGELAIAEAMLTQNFTMARNQSQKYITSLKVLSGITKEIQDVGLGLRMVPLKTLFNRMARVARDLSKKCKKQINFIIKGETTELDKNLVDGLSDPLIHIIRNSIDHGVEQDSQDRLNAGKSAITTIKLEAYQKGGNLHIEITDDGHGINKEKLLERALAAGKIKDVSKLDDSGILNLIFLSGVSTAKTVTDISGRGVGMDVVNDRILELNGKIDIESKQGVGTKLLIKLPLTMAIIDGMVIKTGNQEYVIPTLSIETSLRPVPEMITNAFGGNEFIKIHEKLIPIFRLNNFFDITGSIQEICNGIVVIVEDSGLKTAILVDELVKKQNIVRKDLNFGILETPGISGGTIMSDGKVCLILDINKIVSMVNSKN